MIPSIREIKRTSLFEGTQGAKQDRGENGYFQGFLNDQDAEFLDGFDMVVEEVIDSFIENLSIFQDDFDECGIDDVRLKKLQDVYEEFKLSEDSDAPFDLNLVNDSKIKLILTLVMAFRAYAEMKRDEIGVAMLDNMSDEEYRECVERYKAGYKNILLRKDNKFDYSLSNSHE